MTETYTKPLPEITSDNKPYFDGLNEGRLMLQRCADCGHIRHYPRPVCDQCWSMKVEWVQASGLAMVHSWTITHHPFHQGFKQELPITYITVDLEEGVRLNAQARGIDAAGLKIGQPVRIGFERATDAISLPVIVPPG
jgi:uncharacterized OB-fold protein